jgi:hypothetical protein
MEQLIQLILQILILGMAIPPLRTSKPWVVFLILINQKNKKPLDCGTCLAMWSALAFHLLYWGTPFPLALLASLATAWVGNETDKIFERL